MNFSAVILAGGKSSRMGQDKAFIEFGGKPLLSLQLSLAREIGASEVFISGRAGIDYSAFNCPLLLDELPDRGPLSGIAAAFTAMNNPLLLVLAVDMVNMNAAFLKELHACCRTGVGAVPVHDEILEPLAAFYPKSAGQSLQRLLSSPNQGNSPGAKHFANACVQAGLASLISLKPDQLSLFQSCNSPADMRLFNCP